MRDFEGRADCGRLPEPEWRKVTWPEMFLGLVYCTEGGDPKKNTRKEGLSGYAKEQSADNERVRAEPVPGALRSASVRQAGVEPEQAERLPAHYCHCCR